MKVIVGLGNPEKQYERTRHNAGFRVVDEVAHELHASWENLEKMFSHIARAGETLLVKPQTYMNDSGKAVRAVMHFYKVSPDALMVVHDDLDIPLGTIKLQHGSGPKAHNGLLSLYDALGTKDFWHLRLGVDARAGDKTLPGSAYVLSPMSDQEERVFATMLPEAAAKVRAFLESHKP